MPRYKVHLINASGESHDDTIDAADKMALYNELKLRNETLISADEVSAAAKKSGNFFNRLFNSKVPLREKIIFAKNLSAMLEAGLALARALGVIEKQTRHKKFKSLIVELEKGISSGSTLSDTMKNFPDVFPALMVSMVKAGEESGSLAQSLRVVGTQMESSYLLTKKIKGAMMYPMIIVFAMIVIGFFMLTYVVPTLSATFKELNAQLPLSTRIIVGASDYLKAHFIIVILGIITLGLLFYFGIKTKPGKRLSDFVVLHFPVIGTMAKEVNAARTARTLSSLLSSGVDVVIAIRITTEVLQNSYYKHVLEIVGEKIQKGEPIAHIFSEHENLYPPFVGEMISVGEETGQLAQMLLGVANFYEAEVDQKTKDLSAIIEPFLMIFIGLVVGLFAISIITPIYSLGNNIN